MVILKHTVPFPNFLSGLVVQLGYGVHQWLTLCWAHWKSSKVFRKEDVKEGEREGGCEGKRKEGEGREEEIRESIVSTLSRISTSGSPIACIQWTPYMANKNK